jgi:hypothetical protein
MNFPSQRFTAHSGGEDNEEDKAKDGIRAQIAAELAERVEET